jgi:hypothetical protein
MRFNDPILQSALEAWRRDPDVRERACADNTQFEERVSAVRLAAFEDLVATHPAAPATLTDQQSWYWKAFVRVGYPVPDTFLSELEPARLGPDGLDPFQPILRLEDLSTPLDDAGLTFADLQAALATAQNDVVQKFLDEWNRNRDFRPAFAAWEDQLLDEVSAPDWPDRLRDRMGLGHYNPAAGTSVPVALMRYTVHDIETEATAMGLRHAFAAPTVLDTGPWPYFFPAPAELPYGRAMPLIVLTDHNQLLAEMLHTRLTYRRGHLLKIGEIRQPLGAPDLKALRNSHLMALQLASDRYDFGEEIA